MSKSLKLGDDLSLPLDAVTQTFLVVGKRGSGKSNTAARFVEQLHKARLPFVVLDPVDAWWGLKADAAGGPGLKDIYVFGGQKQDLPLEANGGALIADVLCEHHLSMVLSVKHLSGRARSGFMVAFAQTLFQKWTGGPLHVVLEEAHELAPQMAGGRGNDKDGESAMLGAFKRLWKLGRAQGIGGTAVTQRPASLSKDITTQSEILVAHRTIGPQDVAAIGQWVKYHGEREDILKDLPTLPTGEAFVWAPEFPEGKPIGLIRASILRRETYDSASTPKVGEHRPEPKQLAPADIARLSAKMAETIERAKQDDPRELKKQIQALKSEKAQLERAASRGSSTGQKQEVDKPVLTDADRALLNEIAEGIDLRGSWLHTDKVQFDFEALLADFQRRLRAEIGHAYELMTKRQEEFLKLLDGKRLQKIRENIATIQPKHPAERPGQSRPLPSAQTGRASDATRPAAPRTEGSGEVSVRGCNGAILAVLSQYPDGCLKGKLSLLAGYPYNRVVPNAIVGTANGRPDYWRQRRGNSYHRGRLGDRTIPSASRNWCGAGCVLDGQVHRPGAHYS